MNLLKNYGFNDYFIKEASLYTNYKVARVISQHKGFYNIVVENGFFLAQVSGKFINQVKEKSDYPVVGDFVLVKEVQNTFIIYKILKRRTILSRTFESNNKSKQIIATNLDLVFIIMSLNNNYNLNRLERYITLVFNSGAIPIILLNKEDLCEDIDVKVNEVKCASMFCDIIHTSIFDTKIKEKIFFYLKSGMSAAFIGSSGVGKSSIINKLLEDSKIKTREIGKLDKGRHTTTSSNLFLLSNNSIVIDTPGMREIYVENEDLTQSFSDIEDLALNCKFNDCSHTFEKGCAVINAVNNGLLDKRRYENYLKLKKEESYSLMNYKEIEMEKHNRMFKDIGGFKNARRYMKHNDKRK